MTAAANAAYLATIGASFSNPVTTGLALANAALTLAVSLDAKRSIKFAISNNTAKKMTFLGSHVDCGKINAKPDVVEPGTSAEAHVSGKYGLYGVKLALVYQWGDDERERVVLFLENPVRGANKSGVMYYWDTSESYHWYYCNVPTMGGGHEMKHTINGWFTIKSFVSGGNHAGGGFVLET